MIEHVHLVGFEEHAALDVADEGVVRPGIPQAGHHVVELAGALVALGVLHMVVEPEIQRGVGVGGGDDVPAGAAAADVVDRGELPRQVERLAVGGGGGGDQPDPLGRDGERAERRDRLEPDAAGALHVVVQRELVGEEDRIEQPRLRAAREIPVVADVAERERRGLRMPPRRFMMPAAVDEKIEMKLPFHAEKCRRGEG